jgi:phosphoglucosamine mutase
MKKLFGTDGMRGVAGEFPLDPRTMRVVGASLARQFRERLGREPRFVTGRDTRESGPEIEASFHKGATGAGAHCESAEVITTPGTAYLTRAFGFDAGVVISASHNPFRDNGIKIFLPTGKKIDDVTEAAIEADIRSALEVEGSGYVSSARAGEFASAYLEHLRNEAGGFGAAGRKVIVDCANGASSHLAPGLFKSIGADVIALNDAPDGRNINENCGSLHLDAVQDRVRREGADLGVAFDGDADRALFVDEAGEVVDGDATMWIMARYLKHHAKLANSTVVATVMSNIGLEIALRSENIELLRTDVGDKYVLQKLIETDSELGGEQSGHIIFPEMSLIGDGMMTALLLLRALTERGQTLSQAVEGFVRYPQVLVNVRVAEKRPFDEVPAIVSAANELKRQLDGTGRLLLRYSGTEDLARVMIEGKDQHEIDTQARELASVIQDALA